MSHVVFVTWKAGSAVAFETAHRQGHRVSLVRSLAMERSQHIDFGQSRYQEFVDTVHTLPDATVPAELAACIEAIHRDEPIDGFVVTVDALVVPVAAIAEKLSIRFTSHQGAVIAKHKDRCRSALTAAGLDPTRCVVADDVRMALEFADEVGYPVVVKPAMGSASEGAAVLATASALRACFAGIEREPATFASGVLVEEYLSGRFVSAEIGLAAGRTLPLAVSERKTWSRHEALEVGTTIPANLDPTTAQQVMSFAEKVIRAVGLELGLFHVEIMLGPQGPRLIELNPRLMGSCLPNLFRLATGVDLFDVLLRVHLGQPVELADLRFSEYATVRWFGAADPVATPPPPDVSWAAQYGSALHSLQIELPAGPELAPCRGNLGNFGEVQVSHPDYATSVSIAEQIVERIEGQLGFEVTR